MAEPTTQYVVASKDCKNPEAAFKIINYLIANEQTWVEEGVTSTAVSYTHLFVNSRKGIGTRITILLPIRDLTEQKGKDTEVTLEEDKVGQADERIDR